jgi:hypothetical protein
VKTLRWEFLRDNLDLPAATGVPGARWEPFQVALLNNEDVFSIEAKSRQIAWSWTVAAEAVAEALLDGQSSVFVSINQLEATEKIRYAKAVLAAVQLGGLPKLTRDNDLALEFDNGARIMSLPSRPPRGKARMNVYLDEFAHVHEDRDVYTAALPIISKGGRLRIGSTPHGASGVFWEIFTETLRAYPGFKRRLISWWEVWAFCADVRTARQIAPGLTTAERVARFGNARIQIIYENVLAEYFKQEYEANFVTFLGLVYEDFNRATHLALPSYIRHVDRFIVGVDEGYTNPAVLLVAHLDGDGRMSIVEEVYRRRMLQADFVAEAVRIHEHYRVESFVVDPSAAGLIADLQEHGLPAYPALNVVFAGIQAVKGRLARAGDGRPRLTLAPTCVNTIAELESYCWRKLQTGLRDEPEKINDHAADALRYLVLHVDGAGLAPATGALAEAFGWQT